MLVVDPVVLLDPNVVGKTFVAYHAGMPPWLLSSIKQTSVGRSATLPIGI